MSTDAAIYKTGRRKGNQFDPKIASTFTKIGESRTTDSKKRTPKKSPRNS
jgi:hypothetical protein